MEHSPDVRGGYGATTNCWKDSSNISLETTNLNSKLLSFSRNPEAMCQFRNIYENSCDRHVGENICYESNASKRDQIYLPWSSSAGTIKELGMNVSNASSNMNGDKVVECSLNGLVGAAKSNIEVSRELKGNTRSFNLVLGENSTAFLGNNLDSHHMSTMSADKSCGGELLNNYWKISSLSDITHFNLDHLKSIQNPIAAEMPLGLTPKNSVFVHNAAPTLPKENATIIKKGLQYKSAEMPGAWNMLELSDRDNGPPVRGVQEREFIKNPCVQSPVTITPPTSQDPVQLLDYLRIPKFSEMGDKSRLPGHWMGYNRERFCSKGKHAVSQTYIPAFFNFLGCFKYVAP